MNPVLNIEKKTLKTDGLVRTALWNYAQPLYNKDVQFAIPNFCVQIANSSMINMIDIKIELEHLLSMHSKTYSIKIFDVDSQLLEQVENNQINLDGEYLTKQLKQFFYNNLMILDFASESFYFTKYLKKLSKCRRLPKEALDLAKRLEKKHSLSNIKYADYRDSQLDEFWKDILKSEKTLLDFQSRVHEQGIAVSGDIVLPFTKLIKTRQDVLDVKRINSAWMSLNRVEEKPLIAYIPISIGSLKKEVVVNEICDYIAGLKSDVLVLKVKNLQLTDPSNNAKQREMLASILRTIAKKKQQEENLLTIFLEAGDHVYPLPIQAFDIVSASANLYDKETNSGGSVKEGYGGRAIDEGSLAILGFDEWQHAFNQIGEFPCTHKFCRNRITTMDKSKYTQWQWYVDLRRHNILALTDWMKMIRDSVTSETADLASNRLKNSPYVILNELLVRNYEAPTEDLA